MILVKRRLIIVVSLLCLAAVLFFGVHGYLQLKDSADFSKNELKIHAESYLFISIVSAVGVLLAFAVLLLRSRNISRELDKLIDMVRYGNFALEGGLKRIGPLGDKIRQINQQLSDLNEMRSLRISSLVGINTFLINNIRLALLITDITGKVSRISPRCVDRLKIESAEAVGRHITEILPEVAFQEVVSGIEKKHTPVILSELKDSPSFYPVFNRNNELANLICVLGKEDVITGITKQVEEQRKPGSPVTSLVKKYFRSRRRSTKPDRSGR